MGSTGKPTFCLQTMLRIHFLQQWFMLSDPGMKAHIGADADSSLVHTVRRTYCHVGDISEANAFLHG